ncbi:MAG: redoxin domain-containing protein [Actinomycetota bacterium]
MTVAIGDAAPRFTLLGSEWRGEAPPTFSLDDALASGGVVLHFFPAPFTSTCEAQMCAVRDGIASYEGVTVWGVTTHHPILIARWEAEHRFAVPILADVTGDVARAYVGLYGDEIWPGLRHTARRGVVGISPAGVVGAIWIGPTPGDAPPDDAVAAAIAVARG